MLREELGCTLPIELVWHTDNEMDMMTLNAIQQMWGNITGNDTHRMMPQAASCQHTYGTVSADVHTPTLLSSPWQARASTHKLCRRRRVSK